MALTDLGCLLASGNQQTIVLSPTSLVCSLFHFQIQSKSRGWGEEGGGRELAVLIIPVHPQGSVDCGNRSPQYFCCYCLYPKGSANPIGLLFLWSPPSPQCRCYPVPSRNDGLLEVEFQQVPIMLFSDCPVFFWLQLAIQILLGIPLSSIFFLNPAQWTYLISSNV